MLGNNQGKRLNDYIDSYVVFDLETTGTSTTSDDIVEISAVKVKEGIVVKEFTSLVNPGRSIPFYASQVNGITDTMVKDAPSIASILPDFIKFIEDLTLVGHNIHTFDMKFIYRDMEHYFGNLPDNDYIDTLYMARKCLPELSHHRLVDLAQYYNISTDGAHRALNDCRMNQQVFEHLAKENITEKIKAAGGRVCPKCGSAMKKRNGKFGEFWGCSAYPSCKHTERC